MIRRSTRSTLFPYPTIFRSLMGNCRLPQQFPPSQPNVPTKDGMTVLRHPHKVIFAVTNGMAATLVRFQDPNCTRLNSNPASISDAGSSLHNVQTCKSKHLTP